MNKVLFTAGLVLSALCLWTAAKIEWFNANSETTLPRPQPTMPWRLVWSKKSAESVYRFTNHIPEDQPLTEKQKGDMAAYVDKTLRDVEFRDFVGSWGLLQYITAPLLFLIGVVCVSWKKARPFRLFGVVYILAAVVSMALMLYRAYAPSVL